MYSEDIPKGQLIKYAVSVARDLQDKSRTTKGYQDNKTQGNENDQEKYKDMFRIALILRRTMLTIKQAIPWPPIGVIDPAGFDIPVKLFNFIAWLISTTESVFETDKAQVDDKACRHIMSIAQDLIHCSGRVKTPKHYVLPMAVKSLTGSSAIFCWDNNDILEETLSGRGTTHCTNGIVIQRKVHTCAKPEEENPPIPSRSRHFKGIPVENLPYISGKREGPTRTPTAKEDLKCDPAISAKAKRTDFAWFLTRNGAKRNQPQTVPSWTPFNIAIQNNDVPRECAVGYCQTIKASPTEFLTVYTLLKRSLAMADQLGQTDCIVVLDQAIYAKATEIVWSKKEEFKRVVLRLGSFHTACSFLAILGKRFADAGLADILIESNLIASGSVSAVLEGRHYNRAIHAHKVSLIHLYIAMKNCHI